MKRRGTLCLGLALTACLGLSGCGQTAVVDQSTRKTTVTMMYPIVLDRFEALVEETYPDIDLQVEPTTTATLNGDSERRLRNGHGTDLVVTTLPTGDVKDYMMDLSTTEFAANYQSTVMTPILREGKTLYLPLPGQYAGYILNKTLARQLSDDLPSTNSELLALFDAGRERGIGIGQDGTMVGIEVVSTSAIGSYIIGRQVPDFLGLVDGIRWMDGFESGTAFFSGVWNDCLDTLLTYVERGYLNAQTLALDKTNALPTRERMLDGSLLLCYGNVRLLNQLQGATEQYEFDMLPFLSDHGNGVWATSTPDGYIGINAALGEAGEEDELDACRRILTLLSTQEGQDAWIADTQATNSYLTEYKDEKDDIPDGLKECVAGGYVYDLRIPSNVIRYFGQNMISVLNGKMEMEDALAAVDEYCRNGSEAVNYDQSVVGSVAEDLLYENYNTRREETALGNLVADAVREYTDADIAVVNGGGIRASLYQGDVLGADLSAVCPYANTIVLVEAKGSVVVGMLENGVSLTLRDNAVPAGRFLQVSGLRYAYKPQTNDSPAKLVSVSLPDGTPLDPDARYTLAVNNYMAGASGYLDNNGDGYTMLNLLSDDTPKAEGVTLLKDTGATYADALKAYFYEHRNETITARLEGRIRVVSEEE